MGSNIIFILVSVTMIYGIRSTLRLLSLFHMCVMNKIQLLLSASQVDRFDQPIIFKKTALTDY